MKVSKDTERIRLAAMAELLRKGDPDCYRADLMEMFEGWITSELSDGASREARAEIWFCFRHLCEFFEQVKDMPVA